MTLIRSTFQKMEKAPICKGRVQAKETVSVSVPLDLSSGYTKEHRRRRRFAALYYHRTFRTAINAIFIRFYGVHELIPIAYLHVLAPTLATYAQCAKSAECPQCSVIRTYYFT